MCQAFHTIIIRDVPQLNLRLKSQARRFITLIDTLYDNKVRYFFYSKNKIKDNILFLQIILTFCSTKKKK